MNRIQTLGQLHLGILLCLKFDGIVEEFCNLFGILGYLLGLEEGEKIGVILGNWVQCF